MTRRHFIRYLFQNAIGASLFGTSACSARSAATASNASGEFTYRPLEGRSLRELSARKVHHGDGVYQNPFSDLPKGRLGRVLQWKLLSKNHFKPFYAEEPVTPVALDPRRISIGSGLEITLIKHAGILIKDGNDFLLIDPVFDGLFRFIEDFSPLTFDPATLPQPRHILITHGHYDHLDADSLVTWGSDTHVISPPGYGGLFARLGLTHRQELDWYEQHSRDGREIIFLPCNHWTMRNPLIGPNTGLWGSYLIRTKSGATLYISGDTGYFDGFEQIGADFDIDLAIFNLGAYEPRWFMAPSHMNPEETVRAFRELDARHLAVVHWGTFRLGDEPVHFPPLALRSVLQRQRLEDRYLALEHGRTRAYS